MATDFTLPELGENVSTGDVLRVLVKPGDTIAKDQPVLELETDKATIEVPSSVAGRVAEVKVKPGDKVTVGQAILSVDEGGTATAAAPAEAVPGSAEPSEPAPSPAASSVGANTPQQIPEDGGLEQHVEGRTRQTTDQPGAITAARADAGDDQEAPVDEQERVEREPVRTALVHAGRTPPPRGEGVAAEAVRGAAGSAITDKVVDISRGTRQAVEPAAPELPAAPAAPSVRRMARELGVDVDQVVGSGPGGRISVDDVKAHAKRLVSGATSGKAAAAAPEPLPDFSRWGEVERQPMRAVRRKTAEHLTWAWTTIPHVTQHDVADVTDLEESRQRYAKQAEAAGGNLTITAIAVKVVAAALKVFPQFNASIDAPAGEIIYKKYVNIGAAVDTDRGLLVPVIRNADTKNIVELAVELRQLAEKARTRKISLDELQGGCFTISNLGGIGGTFFTPIVNAPELAILGISRARVEAVYRKRVRSARNAGAERIATAPPGPSEWGGEAAGTEDETGLVPRLMLPLSLSYDHRAIDGADGIRFLRWIVEALEQPFLLALQG